MLLVRNDEGRPLMEPGYGPFVEPSGCGPLIEPRDKQIRTNKQTRSSRLLASLTGYPVGYGPMVEPVGYGPMVKSGG